TCSDPLTYYNDYFGEPGTGGHQGATISGAGSAKVSCSSVFAGGGFQGISGEIEVTPNSMTALAVGQFEASPTDPNAFGVEASLAVSISGSLNAYTLGLMRDGWLWVRTEGGHAEFSMAGYSLRVYGSLERDLLPVKLGVPFT